MEAFAIRTLRFHDTQVLNWQSFRRPLAAGPFNSRSAEDGEARKTCRTRTGSERCRNRFSAQSDIEPRRSESGSGSEM